MSSVTRKIMNFIGAMLVFGLVASIGVPYYAVTLNSSSENFEDKRPIFFDTKYTPEKKVDEPVSD